MNKSRNPGRKAQSGVTLVVVLLLLLVVTLLGIAAMRGAIMQERMSGNARFRAQTFQAAESVLREVEGDLAAASDRPTMPTSGCSAGLCAMPEGGAASAWEADGFWDAAGGYATADDSSADHILRYVVEDMGDGRGESAGCTSDIDLSAPECTSAGTAARNYRITVLSRMSNGAEVLLQSSYQLP